MKKAQRKDFFREIRKSLNRYLSILCMVALGVAFYAGVRSAKPDMEISADTYLDESNWFDIRVLGSRGMTEADVEALLAVEGVTAAEGVYRADVFCMLGSRPFLVSLMSDCEEISRLTIEKGRSPKQSGECFIDTLLADAGGYEIGDTIRLASGSELPLAAVLAGEEYTVVGIGTSPYYLSWDRGTASIGDGNVGAFVVLNKEDFVQPVYTEVDITVDGADSDNCYSQSYQDKVEEVKERIAALGKERGGWYILDRNSVQTYVEYGMDAERIGAIGKVFPAIFFLVAALVSLTTMTRMVEEERTQIGTLKALGYSKAAIAAKYLYYALSASLLGSVLGALAGSVILPQVIIRAYGILYSNIKQIYTPFQWGLSLLAMGIAVASTVLATLLACYKELLAAPAVLMRPTAPKQGKRVWLEYLPFLWKRLNFSGKSTMRNLFRYKKRFFMTVFGIGGCMALLMVGFGLRDSIQAIVDNQYQNLWTYDAYLSVKDVKGEDERAAFEAEMAEKSEVTDSLYVLQTLLDAETEAAAKEVYLFVPERTEGLDAFLRLQNRISKEEYRLQENGVILSEKLAKILEAEEGDTVYLKPDALTSYPVTVTAIAENYLYHYVYMTKELYEELFGAEPEYNQYFLKLTELSAEQRKLFAKDMLAKEGIETVSYVSELQAKVQDMMKSLDLVVWVLIVAAGLLAFIVLYNLNNINIMERKRELATLKVLGFYDKEVAGYVYRENVCLTAVGIAAGMVLGIFLHRFVILTCEIDMIMFGRSIRAASYLYSVVLTIVFALLVNVGMFYKLRAVDMVESLKNIE